MRYEYEDQTQMHNAPQPTSFPNHHTVVGETPHITHYTLANSNLHQPLIIFLYMIPSCKQYWKMYKPDAKYEITLMRNLITKSKYYYKYLI